MNAQKHPSWRSLTRERKEADAALVGSSEEADEKEKVAERSTV